MRLASIGKADKQKFEVFFFLLRNKILYLKKKKNKFDFEYKLQISKI